MSVASNRAHAKLASKRRYTSRTRRGVPSTAPYETAVALTSDDVGDIQDALDNAPGPDVLSVLDGAADAMEQPQDVKLDGRCPHCGKSVTLRQTVKFSALNAWAERLRSVRDKLAEFDPKVLQRVIDGMGKNASLWWTGKGG